VNNRLAWRIAIRESDLDAIAKHVALTLDTYMNRRGLAWPARATLAAGTGRAVSTVDRALTRLEQAGFLVAARSRGRRSNLYCASLPNSSAEETVADALTAALTSSTASLGRSNSPPSAALSRKEAVRSRTPDRSRDQINTNVDPAALELAHRWIADHRLPA
jgi:DNA-binding transcriptional regulator YhcF (GntR family)